MAPRHGAEGMVQTICLLAQRSPRVALTVTPAQGMLGMLGGMVGWRRRRRITLIWADKYSLTNFFSSFDKLPNLPNFA
jgi:hypothetical protein